MPITPAGLLAIAEETLAEFLSKATGTAVNWVQIIGMKPGPDSIRIVAVSRDCSGVAVRACGLVSLEPTKKGSKKRDSTGCSPNKYANKIARRKETCCTVAPRPVLEENIVLGVALEGSKRTLLIDEENDSDNSRGKGNGCNAGWKWNSKAFIWEVRL